ncbi:MAG: hypothetical protein K2I08_05265, partial [Muribaculaceae bacterium]|nr:hypothetical protein [Muribaculaceae bacterium]
MNSFSEFDIKIILAITNEDSHPRILGDIFTNLLSNSDEYAFFVTRDLDTCHVLGVFQTDLNDLQYSIVDFISIISYLKDKGYIILVDSSSVWGRLYYNGTYDIECLDNNSCIDSKQTFPNVYANKYCLKLIRDYSLSFTQTIKDGNPISVGDVKFSNGDSVLSYMQCGNNLRSQLKEILGTIAYPTSKLRNLVHNEFKTEEELYNAQVLDKADKQISKAQTAVVIAIITLLINAIGVILQSFDLTIIPMTN